MVLLDQVIEYFERQARTAQRDIESSIARYLDAMDTAVGF
jgi:hypothetical protein